MSKDLIKRLSHSSEQSIRDDAMLELDTIVKSGNLDYSDLGMRMIFEGIFFCYYHSDKPKYQDALSTKIVNFMNLIEEEEKKQIWNKYFFRCMCFHWNRIDGWRINKYLALIRKQLVAVFKHINIIWDSNPLHAKVYIDSLYDEALKEKDVPLGVGMQIADVYIEEISKNFDKDKLSHQRIVQLLHPLLKGLGTAYQFALFKRIKDSVFNKLLETNGPDADENDLLYFPKFNLSEYAESEILEIASSNEIIESRRDEIYKIYEKASGSERPTAPYIPYEERLKQLKRSLLSPQTKHQKKALVRQKVKKVNKMKKRILKLIQNQQSKLFPGINENTIKDSQNNSTAKDEETRKMELITKAAIDKINGLNIMNIDEPQTTADGTGGTGDKVIEIRNTQLKKKKNKPKKHNATKEQIDGSRKKVSFNVGNNKTKEFFMHGKVSITDIPKSKDLTVKKPGIIKSKHRKA